jgi:hypothetical protein
MSVEIDQVLDRGKLAKERLVLRVTGADDIGQYAIFKTKGTESTVTTDVAHTFWFPDRTVDPSDLVVVYTKSGTQTEKLNKNGHKSYFYYWGLSEPIWSEDDDAVVLLQVATWTPFVVGLVAKRA